MTYSIVARDPVTGELGIAVQSHWFSVGSAVPWARAGVGVVATQSIPDATHGTKLLDLLADGAAPDEAIDEILDGDEAAGYRQTAVLDAQGRVAVHTGDGCIADAGHVIGEGWACQANMMASAGVWPAMAEAYAAAEGPLAERMLAALRAAEGAGGDVRGRQSAAMLVAGGLELRVEDHPDPVEELARLVVLQRAYALATEGDDLTGVGDHTAAGERYEEAMRLAPHSDELVFWAGLSAAQAGDLATGLERVRRSIAMNPRNRDLLARLREDVAPAAAIVRQSL